MRRLNWLTGNIRKMDWEKYFIDHAHALTIFPRTRQTIDEWNHQYGVRMIRKVGGITPNSLVPTGAILLWTGPVPPPDFEWVDDLTGLVP